MLLGKTISIADALKDPALGPGLRQITEKRKAMFKLRGTNPRRPETKIKIRDLIKRNPKLFVDMKKLGRSTEQIIEYYHRLQRKRSV